MSEKRNINITLADIRLSVNITEEDEEIVRKAAKDINELVLKYKTVHEEPEPSYFLAFIALQHTIRMMQQEEKIKEMEEIISKLDAYIGE